MIRTEQIVVDGLRNPHHTALIAHFLHIFADFVASVHGVVSAGIEEIAHVVFLENLQNPFLISVVYIGIRHFIAAGTQGR